jgi:cation:H+ antiporter
VINSLFNNITNLTLLMALPVLIWGMNKIPLQKGKKALREHQMGRLSLALNLIAGLFFSLFLWLLVMDGVLSKSDGFLLVALFFFWQCFHIYDVKKTNLLKTQKYPRTLPLEIIFLLLGAGLIFISTDWLVQWFQTLQNRPNSIFPAGLLGWASGVLMVLPNALLAFYYGARSRMDVVYTSQSGDAHICVPLCVGVYAIFHPIIADGFLKNSLLFLMGLSLTHLFLVILFGRLPRLFAVGFIVAFALFLWLGLA